MLIKITHLSNLISHIKCLIVYMRLIMLMINPIFNSYNIFATSIYIDFYFKFTRQGNLFKMTDIINYVMNFFENYDSPILPTFCVYEKSPKVI